MIYHDDQQGAYSCLYLYHAVPKMRVGQKTSLAVMSIPNSHPTLKRHLLKRAELNRPAPIRGIRGYPAH